MGNRRRAGRGLRRRTGTTTFTAPSRMTIADFSLTRQLIYRNGTPGRARARCTRSTNFGRHRVRGRRALRQPDRATGSTPRAVVWLPRVQRRRAEERGLGRASRRSPATRATPARCTCDRLLQRYARHRLHRCPGGDIATDLRRRDRRQRPDAPAVTVEASGLLPAAAARLDAVTLDASDNGGIRRVEIVDHRAAGVVGAEDTTGPARRTGAAPAAQLGSPSCARTSRTRPCG